MNLDLLKYESHNATGNYLDLMCQHKLIPRIVRPTRIKKQSATLIDHIFTKDNNTSIRGGIIDTEIAGNCGYTDHYPTFLVMKSRLKTTKTDGPIEKSFFTKKNHLDRKECLYDEDWSEIYNLDDPNKIYDMMLDKYSGHYHKNKTTKMFSKRSNRFGREPWMTQDILADIRRRDRLVKAKDRREDYRRLRNDIVKKIRTAEKEYLRSQVESSIGDIKNNWKIIKKVTNKTNNKENTVTSFYYKGSLEEDPQKNAENMNEYTAGQKNVSTYNRAYVFPSW